MVINNIPQGYQDLFLVCYLRSSNSAATDDLAYYFGSSTPTVSNTYLLGDGSTASSGRRSGSGSYGAGYVYSAYRLPAASATSGIFGAVETHILNYAGTSTYKTILTRSEGDQNGAGGVCLNAGTYQTNTAISSITLAWNSGLNFVSRSTVELFGVRTVGQ